MPTIMWAQRSTKLSHSTTKAASMRCRSALPQVLSRPYIALPCEQISDFEGVHIVALDLPEGVSIDGVINPDFEKVLTKEAVAFVADLQRRFNPRREELLAARAERQKRLDAGEKPDFLTETAQIRESDWTVAPLPQDILDRRVEITGPVDRKMSINALNSGANGVIAD